MNKKRLVITILITIFTLALIFGVGYFIASDFHNDNAKNLSDQHYSDRIYQFGIENSSLRDDGVDVLFLGDSLTELYDLEHHYPQFSTVNRGISGDTTFTLEDRLVISAYQVSSQVCVLQIGTNNYDDMFDNYEDIVKDLRTSMPFTTVVLLSLTPTGNSQKDNNATIMENNERIEQISAELGCVYIDVFTPLYDEKTNSIYSEYTTDGTHLTNKGYTVVTDTLTPVLESLVY